MESGNRAPHGQRFSPGPSREGVTSLCKSGTVLLKDARPVLPELPRDMGLGDNTVSSLQDESRNEAHGCAGRRSDSSEGRMSADIFLAQRCKDP